MSDDISIRNITKDFEKYSWEALRQDLIAGISVAMLSVPQAMAFALAAGLPVSCGLLAAIFSAMVVSLFASSRHLIVGPSNVIAILVQGGISMILFNNFRDVTGPERETLVLQILSQLMLLVGTIQIMAGFLKMGRLTHFISHSVIIAYVSGVAIALFITQLFPLLGMDIPPNVSSLYERATYIISHLNMVHVPTALIGVTCFCILIILRKINKKIPSGAFMLAFVALATYFFSHSYYYFANNGYEFINWLQVEKYFQTIPLVGDTRGDGMIPNWEWPYFNTAIMNNILPVAFAIALLSLVEATSAAKNTAARSGQRLSTNQDFFGMGMGNLLSAFIGAMPISGSPSRTSYIFECGATTRLAGVSSCLFVALLLVAFGTLIKDVPVTAFAALLVYASGSIVNIKQVFLCLKATRSDAMVFILTLLACIFFSLDVAFYIGVVLSISLYLKKSAMPQMAEFTVDDEGGIHSIDAHMPHIPKKIRFIKIEGELFFGAADLFQSALKSITEDDTTTRVLIIQLKNARDIDATSCLALEQLHEFMKSSSRYLIACGLTHQIWDVLSDSGMIDVIGKANLFIFDERHPLQSAQRAFRRANELLNEKKPQEAPQLILEPVLVKIEVN